MRPSQYLCIASVCVATLHARVVSGQAPQSAPVPLARFVEATQSDDRIAAPALQAIATGWKNSYTAMVIDLARMMRPPRQLQADASIGTPRPTDDNDSDDGPRPSIDVPMANDLGSPIRRRLLTFLGKQTGQRFGDDLPKWRSWMWTLPYDPHPDYAALKGLIYGQIDSRMREFFPPDVKATIRFDEVDWGGVTVNGIPDRKSVV